MTPRSIVRFATLLVVVIARLSPSVQALPTQWNVNGHWYEAVYVAPPGITWADSRVAAESAGGYLATLTSQEENSFVFSLIENRSEFWNQVGPWVNGPWLGGYQDANDPSYSEPLGGWRWVTGEAWSYTNWMQGEPSGAGQDSLHFCGYNAIAPTLDDSGSPYPEALHGAQPYYGYVVEWGEPVPEPSGLLMLASSILALAGMIRRRR